MSNTSYVVRDDGEDVFFDAANDEAAKRHMQLVDLFGTLYRLDPGPKKTAGRHYVWERRTTRPPPLS